MAPTDPIMTAAEHTQALKEIAALVGVELSDADAERGGYGLEAEQLSEIDRERAEVRAQIERMPGGPGPKRWLKVGYRRLDGWLYIEVDHVELLAARQQLLDRGCVDHPDIDGLLLCP